MIDELLVMRIIVKYDFIIIDFNFCLFCNNLMTKLNYFFPRNLNVFSRLIERLLLSIPHLYSLHLWMNLRARSLAFFIEKPAAAILVF